MAGLDIDAGDAAGEFHHTHAHTCTRYTFIYIHTPHRDVRYN